MQSYKTFYDIAIVSRYYILKRKVLITLLGFYKPQVRLHLEYNHIYLYLLQAFLQLTWGLFICLSIRGNPPFLRPTGSLSVKLLCIIFNCLSSYNLIYNLVLFMIESFATYGCCNSCMFIYLNMPILFV